MTIEVRCPEGHITSVPDRLVGSSMRCPKCSRRFLISEIQGQQPDLVESDDEIPQRPSLPPPLPKARVSVSHRDSESIESDPPIRPSRKVKRDGPRTPRKAGGKPIPLVPLSMIAVATCVFGVLGIVLGALLTPNSPNDQEPLAKANPVAPGALPEAAKRGPTQEQFAQSEIESSATTPTETGARGESRAVSLNYQLTHQENPPDFAQNPPPQPKTRPRPPFPIPNPKSGATRAEPPGTQVAQATPQPTLPAKGTRPVQTFPLPGPARQVVVGGSGQFLVISLPKAKCVTIFDVHTKQVVKVIPVDDQDMVVTAGETKLVVLQRTKGLISRYSLTTFERELTVGCLSYRIICMGSSSEGPLLAIGPADQTRFGEVVEVLDLQTLKTGRIKSRVADGTSLRNAEAAADGQMFGSWMDFVTPTGMNLLEINDDKLTLTNYHDSFGSIVPSPDGRVIYTNKGRFDRSGKRLDRSDAESKRVLVPGATGPFYLELTAPNPAGAAGESVDDDVVPGNAFGHQNLKLTRLAIHSQADELPLATPTDVALQDIPPLVIEPFGKANSLNGKLFFLPIVNAFVALSANSDQLIIQQFSVEEELKKLGRDYLFVVSVPPGSVARGGKFSHTIEAQSKRGNPKFTLEKGPPGMTVSKDGLVTWSVPADPKLKEVIASVKVSDDSKQVISHQLRLNIDETSRKSSAAEASEKPKKPAPVAVKPALAPKPKATASSTAVPVPPRTHVEVKLPAPMDRPLVGGSGKYLVGVLPSLKQVAVLDVAAKTLRPVISVEGDNVQVAAGETRFVVLQGGGKVLVRYNFETLKEEMRVSCETYRHLAMGSSSEGPLMVIGQTAKVLSLETLQPITLKGRIPGGEESSNLRASANSHVFASWQNSGSPSGMQFVEIVGDTVRSAYDHNNGGMLIPSPDGKVVYTGLGRYSSNGAPMDADLAAQQSRTSVPAATGPFNLSLKVSGVLLGPDRGPTELSVRCQNDELPIFTVKDIPLPETKPDITSVGVMYLGLEKKMFLLPAMNALVTLPSSLDRFEIHNFNILEELERSGLDYFFVTSAPPKYFAPGKDFSYQIGVMSKAGNVQYALDSAPPGMTVSKGGLVQWKVPANFKSNEAVAVVKVKDDSDRELMHAVKLVIDQPKAP